MDYLLAVVCTVLGWWFSTGVILFLNHLPAATHRWSMLLATGLFAWAMAALPSTARDVSETGALLAFGQALVIWGWLEMSYLMGFVTGPGNRPCPGDATGWTRFSLALKTSLWHELSVVLVALSVIALTAGAANQVAALTCVVLWLMRWSAKLNLFLGVSNFHAEWLPARQRHLVSYMKQRPINLLFPVSVTAGTAFAVWFLMLASQGTTGAETLGNLVVAVLLSLAVLEHWFLVLPLRDSALWQWALPDSAGEPRLPASRTTLGGQESA